MSEKNNDQYSRINHLTPGLGTEEYPKMPHFLLKREWRIIEDAGRQVFKQPDPSVLIPVLLKLPSSNI